MNQPKSTEVKIFLSHEIMDAVLHTSKKERLFMLERIRKIVLDSMRNIDGK